MLQVLGQALRTLPRNEYVLATKTGRYDVHGFDFSAQKTHDSVRTSLQRLQTDHVDIMQCHDVEYVDINQVRPC